MPREELLLQRRPQLDRHDLRFPDGGDIDYEDNRERAADKHVDVRVSLPLSDWSPARVEASQTHQARHWLQDPHSDHEG